MKFFPIMIKMVWDGNAGLMSSIYSKRKEVIMINPITMLAILKECIIVEMSIRHTLWGGYVIVSIKLVWVLEISLN